MQGNTDTEILASAKGGERSIPDGRRRWLIALVQMNCEKRVSEQLDKLEIQNFVAAQTEVHKWSDRRKVIDRIILPMTVFIYVDEAEQKSLREYSFIYKLMSFPGEKTPAEIPDEQIERFRHMLRCTESPVGIESAPLTVGEDVVISRGSLRGLCGELTSIRNNESHVIIRLDGLGCASVDIPSEFVEKMTVKV